MAVSLAFDTGWGHFMFAYNPCKDISKEEFDFYFTQVPSPSLIFGDFNASHRYWSPSLSRTSENVTGKTLYNILPDYQFSLLTPPDLVTRVDSYSGKTSTLDLCFGSGFFTFPDSLSTEPNMRSDHYPVTIDYTSYLSSPNS